MIGRFDFRAGAKGPGVWTRAMLAVATLLMAAPASAATWIVDRDASHLTFSGTQTGARFEGRFGSWDATIEFDPASPEKGKIVAVIDVASARTGDAQRDTAIPQAEWFDAGAFPQARFETASIRAKGGNSYEAVGTLTLRGISRDVVLPFTLDIQDGVAKAQGKLDLIRTDFGIGQGPWASGQWVGLDVGVSVDLVARRAD